MPSLDQFKEKQKAVEEKRKHTQFQPKRYAPYLLQEEVIKSSASYITQIDLQKSNNDIVKASSCQTTETSSLKQSPIQCVEKTEINCDSSSSIYDQIAKLYGIKKNLLFYFVELCNSRGGLTTGPVDSNVLISVTNSTNKSIKKIIQNMVKESLISRKKGKSGKGGFSIFVLTDVVKRAVMEHKGKMNVKKLEESVSAVSSANSKDLIGELPEEWKEINYSPLNDIGFCESQIRQLYNKKLNTPPIIQASIDHFAFGLKNNKEKFNKYTDPLNVLMGVLRDGGRWIEKNYETPQEQALRTLVEETKKRQESKKQLITEMFELEFPSWEKQLSEQEKKAIVPPQVYGSKIIKGITASLRVYFKEKILLPKLQEQGITDAKDTDI